MRKQRCAPMLRLKLEERGGRAGQRRNFAKIDSDFGYDQPSLARVQEILPRIKHARGASGAAMALLHHDGQWNSTGQRGLCPAAREAARPASIARVFLPVPVDSRSRTNRCM